MTASALMGSEIVRRKQSPTFTQHRRICRDLCSEDCSFCSAYCRSTVWTPGTHVKPLVSSSRPGARIPLVWPIQTPRAIRLFVSEHHRWAICWLDIWRVSRDAVANSEKCQQYFSSRKWIWVMWKWKFRKVCWSSDQSLSPVGGNLFNGLGFFLNMAILASFTFEMSHFWYICTTKASSVAKWSSVTSTVQNRCSVMYA